MDNKNLKVLLLPASTPATLVSLEIEAGSQIQNGTLLATYSLKGQEEGVNTVLFKSSTVGKVQAVLHKEGDMLQPNEPLFHVEENCDHSIVVFDMCANCGLNLKRNSSTMDHFPQPVAASVSMIHGIPELRVSQKEAEELGNKDRLRLLKSRKLALIVDLDQTLVHTSMDPNIEPGLPDVYGFHLPDHHLLYHCRLRPHTRDFLERISPLFELHVFTMGTKSYAASVTNIIDPNRKLFCDRIISRDECFDPRSKVLRLKSLFPCGDSMVAIIDDREDVWGRSPNLIHVKPYMFFKGTTDINAPPPLHSRPRSRQRGVGKVSPATQNPPPFKTRHAVKKDAAYQIPHKQKIVTFHPLETVDTGKKKSPGSCDLPGGISPNSGTNDTSLDLGPSLETSSKLSGLADDPLPNTAPSAGALPEAPTLSEPGTHSIGAPTPSEPGICSIDDTLPSISPETSTETRTSLISGTYVTDDMLPTVEPSDMIPLESALNTNSNNNNNTTAMGGVDQAEGDSNSSDTSSDSESDSSSSSGIDDALFDQSPSAGNGETSGELVSTKEEEGVSFQEDGLAEKNGEGMDVAAKSEDPMTPPDSSTSEQLPRNRSLATVNISQSGKKLREIQDPDNFLISLADILERIHKIFYEKYDTLTHDLDVMTNTDFPIPDLKQIIPELRQSILKDCRIIFTGVIPTNIPVRKNREWNTAKAFGAIIHNTLVPGLNSSKEDDIRMATTHVIAGKPGTTKLMDARRMPGVKIVSPRWLWSCAEQWKIVDESDYPVQFEKNKRRKRKGPPEKIRRVANREGENAEVVHGSEDTKEEKMKAEALEESSDSDSDSEDDLFEKKPAFAELKKMDTTEVKRHYSMESRLSVSDEELEKMEAEVEAEISESSSEGEKEDLGSHMEQLVDNSDEISYEKFAGTHVSQDIDILERLNRKRHLLDLDGSSSSESVVIEQLNESFLTDEENESGDGDDDELGALLGF